MEMVEMCTILLPSDGMNTYDSSVYGSIVCPSTRLSVRHKPVFY